jgi:hypothetical protein
MFCDLDAILLLLGFNEEVFRTSIQNNVRDFQLLLLLT